MWEGEKRGLHTRNVHVVRRHLARNKRKFNKQTNPKQHVTCVSISFFQRTGQQQQHLWTTRPYSATTNNKQTEAQNFGLS